MADRQPNRSHSGDRPCKQENITAIGSAPSRAALAAAAMSGSRLVSAQTVAITVSEATR